MLKPKILKIVKHFKLVVVGKVFIAQTGNPFCANIARYWVKRGQNSHSLIYKHRKNCECCPVSLFIVRSLWLSCFDVLKSQKCQQFHNFSRISIWRCSLNVFVSVCVFVFVRVFLPCLQNTLIIFPGSLCCVVKCLIVLYWAVWQTL